MRLDEFYYFFFVYDIIIPFSYYSHCDDDTFFLEVVDIEFVPISDICLIIPSIFSIAQREKAV